MAVTELEVQHGETVDERNYRVLVAKDSAEFHALAHIRGWCHNFNACPVCETAQRHREWGKREAIKSIAEG